MRVLIADDDPETCHLVAEILRSAGHQALVARDAMQAFMAAQRHLPDLIVLDIQMPAGTGIGALRKLKASLHTEGIPVVVLSGVTDQAVEQQALSGGAVVFLHKPVDGKALLAALAEAVPPGEA